MTSIIPRWPGRGTRAAPPDTAESLGPIPTPSQAPPQPVPVPDPPFTPGSVLVLVPDHGSDHLVAVLAVLREEADADPDG